MIHHKAQARRHKIVMCDKTSTIQVLVLLLAALLGFAPGCDSNPTPHPGRQDASGGKGVAGQPNEGYVDGPADDADRDPAASPDAGQTGEFTGVDGDVVQPDAGPDAGDSGPPEDAEHEGEVAPAGSDNAGACPGEAADYDPDDDGRLGE